MSRQKNESKPSFCINVSKGATRHLDGVANTCPKQDSQKFGKVYFPVILSKMDERWIGLCAIVDKLIL